MSARIPDTHKRIYEIKTSDLRWAILQQRVEIHLFKVLNQ